MRQVSDHWNKLLTSRRDEGFHLQLIGEWDNGLRLVLNLYLFKAIVTHVLSSLEILKDWFSLIDEDGWVGREQILGEEARSKVRVSADANSVSA